MSAEPILDLDPLTGPVTVELNPFDETMGIMFLAATTTIAFNTAAMLIYSGYIPFPYYDFVNIFRVRVKRDLHLANHNKVSDVVPTNMIIKVRKNSSTFLRFHQYFM